MSRIDELPADRRAVLQLLLKQGKSYSELAGLLHIDEEKVRERARDALDALGPEAGSGLDLDHQNLLSDYLLSQQPVNDRPATRRLLEESAAARAWARVVSGELRPFAAHPLPEIPDERAAPPPRAAAPAAERPPRRERERKSRPEPAERAPRERPVRSSRLGGLLLIGAIAAGIAVLIIVLVSGGGGGSSKTTSTSRASTTSTQPQVVGQVNLNPPNGAASKALAAVTLVRQGTEIDLLFQGQGITPNKTGDVYALWVTGDNGTSQRLGFMPRVGKSGKVRFPGALPSGIDLSKYKNLLMTRETTANPPRPGQAVLEGALP